MWYATQIPQKAQVPKIIPTIQLLNIWVVVDSSVFECIINASLSQYKAQSNMKILDKNTKVHKYNLNNKLPPQEIHIKWNM